MPAGTRTISIPVASSRTLHARPLASICFPIAGSVTTEGSGCEASDVPHAGTAGSTYWTPRASVAVPPMVVTVTGCQPATPGGSTAVMTFGFPRFGRSPKLSTICVVTSVAGTPPTVTTGVWYQNQPPTRLPSIVIVVPPEC